jgi:excisionase family DNA binding protein
VNEKNSVLDAIAARSDWLSMKQAAAYMNCTNWYVKRLCQEARIPFAKVGHKYILNRRDCDAYMESLKKTVEVE